MAADDDEMDPGKEQEEEEEDWTETVPLDGLDHGRTTIFVGGFSSVTSVAQALELWAHKDDQILVLPGTYEADVSLDATVHSGMLLTGDASVPPSQILFKGLLDIAYTPPPRSDAAATDPAAAEDEESPANDAPPPRPLAVANMTFLAGAVFTELTDCDIRGCVFGQQFTDASLAEAVPRTVRIHGLSSTRLKDCTVYGLGRSAVYAYPHARAQFNGCTVIGATPMPPPVPENERRRKRIVAPPPPPPSVPSSCECEVGLHLDDSEATVTDCTVRNFNIGVVLNDHCVGTVLERCTVSEVATVGALFGAACAAAMRSCTIKLCGRECAVIGSAAHPTLRSNVFVGDVRLKAGAIGTGISDNILGLNGQLIVEAPRFVVKGFTVIAKDPTIVKPKKVEESPED